jgi:hypothetical protein
MGEEEGSESTSSYHEPRFLQNQMPSTQQKLLEESLGQGAPLSKKLSGQFNLAQRDHYMSTDFAFNQQQ